MIRVEHLQSQPPVTGGSAFVSSSVPLSPNRSEINDKSTTSSVSNTAADNGSVFTLTNIYTFGENANQPKEKYRINSIVEVFDPPSATEFERHYRETHSSSSITRKTQTTSSPAAVPARPGPGSLSFPSRSRHARVIEWFPIASCLTCLLRETSSSSFFSPRDYLVNRKTWSDFKTHKLIAFDLNSLSRQSSLVSWSDLLHFPFRTNWSFQSNVSVSPQCVHWWSTQVASMVRRCRAIVVER